MTELRDYQVEAVEKLETAINLGQCPLYVPPTAGGKTIIASHIIERAVAQQDALAIDVHGACATLSAIACLFGAGQR
jgi:superfamily II DNA or RNA helicase